jgi:hypothetical protein
MPDNREWTTEFKDNSFFRICENQYYKENGKYTGLKEMDYCYFTGSSLDFIECKEVKNIKNDMKIDCALKGVHSLALVKTGLLENHDQFQSGIKKLPIPKNITINIYFVFKVDYEQKSQLQFIQPFIEDRIKCFKKIWNIIDIQVLDYEKAKEKLKYIINEKYI